MRNHFFKVVTILFWSFFLSTTTMAEEKINVTFLNPATADDSFWMPLTDFMSAAAKDLNINLEVLNANRNHLKMIQQAEEVVQRFLRPDYLVFVNEKQAAEQIMKLGEASQIKMFLLNSGFIGDQADDMGRPREKYQYWVGELMPNDQSAGYKLAKLTIDQGLQAGLVHNEKLQLAAIAGERATSSSIERVKGLEQALSEYPNVKLKQITYGGWKLDKGYQQAKVLLARYPQVGVIWTANDSMALGAMEAAIEAKKIPGKDIFLGGVNWTPPALAAVQKGCMVATIGGHFMDGGWLMVLLHDYHRGRDFINDNFEHQMFALDADNITSYLQKFEDKNWDKIDFSQFSKVLNPNLTKYDFDLEKLL